MLLKIFVGSDQNGHRMDTEWTQGHAEWFGVKLMRQS